MDRDNLQLAAKLLAKAQNTNFDAEAAALAEKAYRLLAELLNAYEVRPGRLASPDAGSAGIFGIVGPSGECSVGGGPRTGQTRRRPTAGDAEETGEPGEGEIDLKA